MDWTYILLLVLAYAIIAVGLAGAVLPALPGLPFVFGGLWLLAWLDGYQQVGVVTLSILGVLLVFGMILDFIAGSLGAKKVGASPQAIGGAMLGAFIGIFFGLWGLILGPFIGAVLGEMKAQKSLDQAARSGIGTWVGLMLGMVAKLVIALVMIGIFVFQYFF
tara:strand:- start:5732 stop:6220 length:489 start_codon:yes stop_codon:yes gene_type:complete